MSTHHTAQPRRKVLNQLAKIIFLLVITGLVVNAVSTHRVESRICTAQNNAFTAVDTQIDNGKITITQRLGQLQIQRAKQVASGKSTVAIDAQIAIDNGSLTRSDALKEKIAAVDCGGFLR